MDFTIGSVIGIILYVLLINISRATTSKLEFNDKIQKEFIIKFLSALCFICLAFTSFSSGGKLQNRAVKWGLILSGASLGINTMIINWHELSDSTKLILIGLCLAVVVWYAYYYEYSKSDNENDDEDDNEDDNEYEDYDEDEYNNKETKYKQLDENDYETAINYTPVYRNDIRKQFIPKIDPQIFMRY